LAILKVGQEMVLPWFDGKELRATAKLVEEARDVVNLYGEIEENGLDPFTDVFLTIRGNKLIGSVFRGGETFRLIPQGEAGYLIIQTDPDQLPEGNDAVSINDGNRGSVVARDSSATLRKNTSPRPRANLSRVDDLLTELQRKRGIKFEKAGDIIFKLLPDDGSQIDLLFGYTQEAKQWFDIVTMNDHGLDITLFLEHSVWLTNTRFALSGVQTRLRIVGFGNIGFYQVKDLVLQKDIDLLQVPFLPNSPFNVLHTLRDEKRADLVSLIVRIPPVPLGVDWLCGLGAQPKGIPLFFNLNGKGARAEKGFNIVEIGCEMTNGDVVSHEVGHNLGAGHDIATFLKAVETAQLMGLTPFDPEFPIRSFIGDAFGFITQNNIPLVRTIMAYQTYCKEVLDESCPRIGRFSNPLVTYQGAPTGILGTQGFPGADNVSVMNLYSWTAANYLNSHGVPANTP
jgi:hypothetical protein